MNLDSYNEQEQTEDDLGRLGELILKQSRKRKAYSSTSSSNILNIGLRQCYQCQMPQNQHKIDCPKAISRKLEQSELQQAAPSGEQTFSTQQSQNQFSVSNQQTESQSQTKSLTRNQSKQLQAKNEVANVISEKLQLQVTRQAVNDEVNATKNQFIKEQKSVLIRQESSDKDVLKNLQKYQFSRTYQSQPQQILNNNVAKKKQLHSKKRDLLSEDDKQRSKSKKRAEKYNIDYRILEKNNEKKLKFGSHTVLFPFEPYKPQLNYMSKIIQALDSKQHALLESPTGTGKTLCLLSSLLCWTQEHFQEKNQRIKVLYLSRTHSQLAQVQKELQKTSLRPTMAIIGSRDQLCVKTEFAHLRGKEKIEACGKGVKLARKLKRQNNRNLTKGDISTVESSAACQFFRERESTLSLAKSQFQNRILDVQKIRKLGQQHTFCPYFYPQHVKQICSLYLMPYNYLLDVFLLNTYAELVEGNIIVFDEAHNIPEAAESGRTNVISTTTFDLAVAELNRIFGSTVSQGLLHIREHYELQTRNLINQLLNFKESFVDYFTRRNDKGNSSFGPFHNNCQQENEQNEKVIEKNKFEEAIYQLFVGQIPDSSKHQFSFRKQRYIQMMHRNVIRYLQEVSKFGNELIDMLQETPDGGFINLDNVVVFIVKVMSLISPGLTKTVKTQWIDQEINHHRILLRKTGNLIQVQLRCLAPWLTIKDLFKHRPRNIILTSGTLSPMDSWAKQLKVNFKLQLTNSHVITPQQVEMKILKTGLGNVPFNFSFDSLRKSFQNIYKSLLLTLKSLFEHVPNGILVVCPSFKVLINIKAKADSFNLHFSKYIFFEQKQGDSLVEQFKIKALTEKGAVFFCVCRGKSSEGIDYPNELCRAVVIIGVPYPNIRDPMINQKKEHLNNIYRRYPDQETLRGDDWYQLGTMRTVNQALGRLIRHRNDYGMLFLLDNRYSERRCLNMLPNWTRDSCEIVEEPGRVFFQRIDEFYQQMEKKYSYSPAKVSKKSVSGQKDKSLDAFLKINKPNQNEQDSSEPKAFYPCFVKQKRYIPE